MLLQEEDEVPDDETLNQMIARNEDEFELYMVSNAHLSVSCHCCLNDRVCPFARSDRQHLSAGNVSWSCSAPPFSYFT